LVRNLRTERGWSQQDLADKLGEKWDKSRVSKLEADRLPLSLETRRKLADAFGVEPTEFFWQCVKHHYQLAGTEVCRHFDAVVAFIVERGQKRGSPRARGSSNRTSSNGRPRRKSR
jgi:transcriptional regulator with XRE-family HTH domain